MPGARASDEARASYAGVRRHVASFEEAVLEGAGRAEPLMRWFPELGRAARELVDLSGGRWRTRFYPSERDYPASHVQQERRKFLVHNAQGSWLLRFAGIGPHMAELAARARHLGELSITPPVQSLEHGFTLARWAEGRPLPCAAHSREALLRALTRYLTVLATRFAVPPERSGASLESLFDMAAFNTGELLGPDAVEQLAVLGEQLPALHAQARPVAIDGKLDAHEWLVTPDGRVLKTDALDHHIAHDLIGCQDIAWDLAGARVELALSDAELEALLAALRDAGRPVSPRALSVYEPLYLAFRAGHATLAASSLAECAGEAERMQALAQRYRQILAHRLGASGQA